MNSTIAIVGMACCYPDAKNPLQMWQNVVTQRRAFRRLPPERLFLPDYFSGDLQTHDAIYAAEAALIEGYEFDRVRFRVAGPTFRSVDLTHWLALDVADQALADAGFADGHGLPLETTGVLVGNTLTGEFSRATQMRLRWPYVRRVLETRLLAEGWQDMYRAGFLHRLEELYKAPFPPVGEETLAGALSNTIAGRICNYFHFGGGGYTVDGACSSSLLAVARACSALEAGEIDAALAGGVDLSVDPFELVGFAKAGALAHGEMRIYDTQSTGFLPGEGSGFVLLVRSEDAFAQGLRTYANIRGWGVSSDGGGSITRPDVRGQKLSLERAYRRAGFGAETVALFEGHGTGTPVGDEVELTALSSARRAAGGEMPPAAIGSIKANIGHTKAAAGIAGLIKATLAINHELLPPTTGVRRPRPEVQGEGAVLRVLNDAEPWPGDLPLRAGINSFGFGGINVHVVIEGCRKQNAANFSSREPLLVPGIQDVELFLLDADNSGDLSNRIAQLARLAPRLSYSELTDISTTLASRLGQRSTRAAVVAGTPEELRERLEVLHGVIEAGTVRHVDPKAGVFLGVGVNRPRIVFLFPGQASPVRLGAGIQGRRYPQVAALYRTAALPRNGDIRATETAQLAIVTAELAGIRLLNAIGVEASAALGHSLGELTAYYWAQALDESSLLGLVRARGRLMSEIPARQGAMASISASAAEVESLLEKGEPIVVACFNAPRQVVVSGESNTVTRVVLRAQVSGRSAILLSTSHAFHSPLMSASAENFREVVASFPFGSLRRPVISTITGRELSEACDLRRLLVEQLSRPVRFLDALIEAEQGTDLFVEVGPGLILTHLLQDISKKPVVSLDVAGDSLAGVLQAAASAYVLGAPLKHDALFDCRFARPFDLDWHPRFFANPCELAPPSPVVIEDAQPTVPSEPQPSRGTESSSAAELTMVSNDAPLHVVQELVARRTELPASAVSASSRFLRDLHLNSMVVGEIVAATARRLGVPPPGHLLQFADATVSELAHALEQIRANHGSMTPEHETIPVGVDEWVRPFLVDWLPRPLQPRTSPAEPFGTWQAFGPPDHPLLESLSPISLPGNGTIVCLSEAPLEEQVAFLLSGAQAVLRAAGRDRYFVVTAPFSAAGSFARTLGLENPDILTRVIEADIGPDLIAHMRAELSDIPRHVEARYDSGGQRYEAGFKLLGNTQEDGIPLRPGDLVLVSGGGKGIAAECAMLLAQESGARLVLLGRSRTEDDPVLAAHLRKIEASGVQAKYIRSDVANPQSVSAAVSVVEQMYGPVVGIIHGAGHNEPRMVKDLDELALRRTLAPKVQGFRNLVAAVDPERLRLLVTFGSVIGRVGLWGEADYALANSYLSSLVERFARAHTHCHCLAFESSAWAGIGMAERLGKVEALRSAGITAIKPATGVSWFRNLVARRLTAVTVVLTGRLGASSPIPLEGSPLPLLRFLERPRVHYPGVELIVEAELTLASDAYLLDHVFQGQPLLPAVVGLEAMVQAAQALVSDERIPVLEGVRFDRPVVVEGGARVTVRIAALVQDTGRVDVALRSSQTSFQVDHFRCSCVFTDTPSRSEHMIPIPDQALLPVHPERDLYGRILFQGPRFQRLKGYRRLSARFSSAEIATASPQSWFSEYLPNSLILGDPAARDAALHSIQACVPQATLLPISVDRILPSALNSDEPLMAHAREQWQGGDTYCYDLELRTKDGILRESWEGLRLRKVADAGKDGWPDALVAAFLEWQVRESTPTARVFAALERDVKIDRQQRSQRAIRRALDAPCSVRWRHDGKPEVDPPFVVSSAHADPLTLAVAGVQVVACDLERIRARPEEVWHDLLGDERFLLARVIADQSKEDFHTAATRIWTATEALAKAEASPDAPLVLLLPPFDHGGISLTSPGFTIVTTVIRSHDEPAPIAVAILSRSEK